MVLDEGVSMQMQVNSLLNAFDQFRFSFDVDVSFSVTYNEYRKLRLQNNVAGTEQMKA